MKKIYKVTRENQERGKFFHKAKFFKADLSSKKDRKSLPIYGILICKEEKEKEPLILLTSLEVTEKNLQEITSIYNKRSLTDTLFETLKQNFGLERIMVRKWQEIKIMIRGCLLSFILNLCMFLKATKASLLTVGEFCKRKSVLKGGKLTIGKFSWQPKRCKEAHLFMFNNLSNLAKSFSTNGGLFLPCQLICLLQDFPFKNQLYFYQ